MDWFSYISNWKDEDERKWRPTVYRRFEGMLENTALGNLEYDGIERDWNVDSYSPEENLKLGRVIVLRAKNNLFVCCGDTEEEAVEKLRRLINLYVKKKRSNP